MQMKTTLIACGLLAASVAPALHAQKKAATKADTKVKPDVPVYRVDPFWPKLPLPNKMIMQQVVETEIDKDDHVWIINRADPRADEMGAMGNPPRAICCQLGPDIIEFDTAGNVLKTISGANIPGWPQRLQSLNVDHDGNLWVSGTGTGDSIIKISQEGKLLWDFGHRAPKVDNGGKKGEKGGGRPVQNNQQTDTLNGIGAFALDEAAHEIYVADGFVNKRILVYDMNSGAFKRGWGGHGVPLSEISNEPTPNYDINGLPPDQKEFAPILHCVVLSKDGLVYVCERGSNRVQVFTKEGKFVSAFWVHPETQARGENCGGPFGTSAPCGTVFHLTLSHDPQPQDGRTRRILRRQRPLRRAASLDRRHQCGLQRQPVHGRSGRRKARSEICDHQRIRRCPAPLSWDSETSYPITRGGFSMHRTLTSFLPVADS